MQLGVQSVLLVLAFRDAAVRAPCAGPALLRMPKRRGERSCSATTKREKAQMAALLRTMTQSGEMIADA